MNRVLFRADAKPTIGTGDLASLVYLGRYCEEQGWEAWYMVQDFPAARNIVRKYGLPRVKMLPPDLPLEQEVREINACIEDQGMAAAVFEITERPLADYQGLSERVFKACVHFHGPIPAGFGLVVNWDVEAQKRLAGMVPRGAEILTGPELVLLPPEFTPELARTREHRLPPQRILVAMGGADEGNTTLAVIRALARAGWAGEVRLVLGPGYRYEDELAAFLASSDLECTVLRDLPSLFPEYLDCDAAIGAGGLTASEMVATGTPCVLIAPYVHQIPRCRYFASIGAATFLGETVPVPEVLADALRGLRPPVEKLRFAGKQRFFQAMQNLAGRGRVG